MTRVRVCLVVVMLMLLTATNVFADPRPLYWDRPDIDPISIINDANDVWSIKVWAYPGWATEWQTFSCQTLGYSTDRVRDISTQTLKDAWARPIYNHCGDWNDLTFWFRMWNTKTGDVRDYSTFGSPTPWGATWRWDGKTWTCFGC